MLAGGVAAGIVGTKLLPAAFGALGGWRRARAGGDPFAQLIDDHRRILSLLGEMAAETSGNRAQRSHLFLMLKRKLAKHALAEEDVVYPIVHNQSAEHDDSRHLYDQHADMKILLYELEGKVKGGQDWAQDVARLTELIRGHVDEEERVIFPQLRTRLTVDKLPRVSGQISREEALIV
jgi:hemerythrin superfamily protein